MFFLHFLYKKENVYLHFSVADIRDVTKWIIAERGGGGWHNLCFNKPSRSSITHDTGDNNKHILIYISLFIEYEQKYIIYNQSENFGNRWSNILANKLSLLVLLHFLTSPKPEDKITVTATPTPTPTPTKLVTSTCRIFNNSVFWCLVMARILNNSVFWWELSMTLSIWCLVVGLNINHNFDNQKLSWAQFYLNLCIMQKEQLWVDSIAKFTMLSDFDTKLYRVHQLMLYFKILNNLSNSGIDYTVEIYS